MNSIFMALSFDVAASQPDGVRVFLKETDV
jgi:hypothetical protein